MNADLEMLREIFKDQRLHFGIGTITQLGLSLAGDTLRVKVMLLPENREIVASMSWPDVRIISFPVLTDLVNVAFVDGHPDEAYVIGRVTTTDEVIPTLAQAGNLVVYSRPGKNAYFGSDTKFGLARPDVDPTNPLVLGDILVNAFTDLLNIFVQANPLVDTPLGPGFLDPAVATSLTQWKNTYLTTSSSNIISQVGFTERGT